MFDTAGEDRAEQREWRVHRGSTRGSRVASRLQRNCAWQPWFCQSIMAPPFGPIRPTRLPRVSQSPVILSWQSCDCHMKTRRLWLMRSDDVVFKVEQSSSFLPSVKRWKISMRDGGWEDFRRTTTIKRSGPKTLTPRGRVWCLEALQRLVMLCNRGADNSAPKGHSKGAECGGLDILYSTE